MRKQRYSLEEWRRRYGLSRGELAERATLARSTIWRIEQFQHLPCAATRRQIVQALGGIDPRMIAWPRQRAERSITRQKEDTMTQESPRAGPARRFYFACGVNFQLDLNRRDARSDLAGLLAEEDYRPIGGPPLPGWRLYRQQPPRHRSPEYVAVSDTDGTAQVVAFVADRADLFALLSKWGNLYQLLPEALNLEKLAASAGIEIVP